MTIDDWYEGYEECPGCGDQKNSKFEYCYSCYMDDEAGIYEDCDMCGKRKKIEYDTCYECAFG